LVWTGFVTQQQQKQVLRLLRRMTTKKTDTGNSKRKIRGSLHYGGKAPPSVGMTAFVVAWSEKRLRELFDR
jgi:hypothetical protein